jgi:hypothetical protein
LLSRKRNLAGAEDKDAAIQKAAALRAGQVPRGRDAAEENKKIEKSLKKALRLVSSHGNYLSITLYLTYWMAIPPCPDAKPG